MSVRLGPLAGHPLVVFDKDGTLIDFDAMWGGWADRVVGALERETGRSLRATLADAYGIDLVSGTVRPHGLLAATPMSVLRRATVEILAGAGVAPAEADRAVAATWSAPDPVGLAHPLADLPALFGAIRASGGRIAIATSDDREPTIRTLAALGIAPLVDAVVCADDGLPVKPAPDMVVRLAGELGIDPAATVVVGDTVADLAMGRAAGVHRCVGVLSGVGTEAELAPLADVIVASIAELEPDRGGSVSA